MRPCVGLRFLKYSPGEYFKPHMDGVYATPDASMENGGFKVGDTKVLSNKDDMINIGVALTLAESLCSNMTSCMKDLS